MPFPFSDLSATKRRPALVVADLQGSDVILCQITSRAIRDSYAISLGESDFEEGGLKNDSSIRPNRLFTADETIVSYKAGVLSLPKMTEVTAEIIAIIRESRDPLAVS